MTDHRQAIKSSNSWWQRQKYHLFWNAAKIICTFSIHYVYVEAQKQTAHDLSLSHTLDNNHQHKPAEQNHQNKNAKQSQRYAHIPNTSPSPSFHNCQAFIVHCTFIYSCCSGGWRCLAGAQLIDSSSTQWTQKQKETIFATLHSSTGNYNVWLVSHSRTHSFSPSLCVSVCLTK